MTLQTPPREPDSVPVLNSTPLPAFTQAWQLKPPKDAVILIVKGTFDLVQGGPATPAGEQEFPLGPVPFDDHEEALRYPGDIAYFKPRCDVLMVGHAYKSEKSPAIRRVHIDLGRQLSFSMAAIGERRWDRGVPSPPEPFERIPLRPDRAYGGPGSDANPVGVGRHAEDGSPLPNFEQPDRLIQSQKDRPPPAMTTPVPQTWEERRKHAGTYKGDWVKKRAPYFPDDFRWDYFQCAPAPLQIPYPRGDEWYRLRGVRPNDESLEGRLPCLKMRAFAQPLHRPNELQELPLNLDTVWFDPDQLQLVLVWRGAITTADQYGSDLASFLVLAEPFEQPCGTEEIHRRFRVAYAEEYERGVEEDEPDAPEAPAQPPEGYVPPRGLTTDQARGLGLPAWAATIESPPVEPRPPPPPTPALTPKGVDDQLDSDASLAGVDFTSCDLSGRDLGGRDLSAAVMIGAILVGAKLAGANLQGAVMTEANLEGGDLAGADLSGAVLDEAVLTGAMLDGANLSEASLSKVVAIDASLLGANLDGVIAHQADLTRAKLDGASLVAADLTESKLEEASLVGANMEDVRLYGVFAPRMVADDAIMTRCRIDGGIFMGSSFARLKAPDSSMRKCDMSDCNFLESVLEESVLEDAVFDRSNVNQVEAKECRWPRARARGATFVKTNLMRGYFEGAHFAECDMRGANLYQAETFRARFEACQLEHAILGESGLG